MKILYCADKGIPTVHAATKPLFINEIITFVEAEQLDAEIVEHENTIRADILFNDLGVLTDLKQVIAKVDTAVLFTEANRITLSLTARYESDKPFRL